MNLSIAQTGIVVTMSVCGIISIIRGTCRPDKNVGIRIKREDAKLQSMTRERKNEIFDFCYDLGLLWARYCPSVRFGDIVQVLNADPDISLKTDAECMDLVRKVMEDFSA